MMPFYQTGSFDYPAAMAMATVLGVGFGFVLERAGFGRGDILAAQFYGTNNRVLKVMFGAVATTAIGLGLLGGIGAVDMSAIVIPETFLNPQIVGGLLLGAGFVISGYCPGTSAVAAGSGHLDALYALGGIMLGTLVFGFMFPLLEGFYGSSAMGVVTFPDLLGIPWAVVALAVLALAVGSFVGAEKLERHLAQKHGTEVPDDEPRTRNRVFIGLGIVAALGVVTIVLPTPTADKVSHDAVASMDATALAQRLAKGNSELYLVDLRDPATCAADRIPGAMCITEEDPDAGFLANLPPTRTLVVYGDGDLAKLPEAAHAYAGSLQTVAGGYAAFKADILTAPKPPAEATREAVEAYRTRAALHSYFTGSNAPAAPVKARPKAVKRAAKKGGGC